MGFWVKAIGLVLGLIAQVSLGKDHPQEVRFFASDGLEVFGSYYPTGDKTRPLVLLFHMSGSNRYEYAEVAPALNRWGFNALAIDQRSGGSAWGKPNKTASQLPSPVGFMNALPDLEASLRWARQNGYRGKIVVVGSSYSAALAILLAVSHPQIVGVVAFSPGEYLSPLSVKLVAARLQIPILVTGAKHETALISEIWSVIPSAQKVLFMPQEPGMHGAWALSFARYKREYWAAFGSFMTQFRS